MGENRPQLEITSRYFAGPLLRRPSTGCLQNFVPPPAPPQPPLPAPKKKRPSSEEDEGEESEELLSPREDLFFKEVSISSLFEDMEEQLVKAYPDIEVLVEKSSMAGAMRVRDRIDEAVGNIRYAKRKITKILEDLIAPPPPPKKPRTATQSRWTDEEMDAWWDNAVRAIHEDPAACHILQQRRREEGENSISQKNPPAPEDDPVETEPPTSQSTSLVLPETSLSTIQIPEPEDGSFDPATNWDDPNWIPSWKRDNIEVSMSDDSESDSDSEVEQDQDLRHDYEKDIAFHTIETPFHTHAGSDGSSFLQTQDDWEEWSPMTEAWMREHCPALFEADGSRKNY